MTRYYAVPIEPIKCHCGKPATFLLQDGPSWPIGPRCAKHAEREVAKLNAAEAQP